MSRTTYAAAGVDISAAEAAKKRIAKLARATFNKNVLAEVGGFGALYAVPDGYQNPVLVSSLDGVGTKLKLAFATGQHASVARDLVHHCVNDILVQGARPLFFLDYLAMGAMDAAVAAEVVSGLAGACQASGCALIGGETAAMPGFYPAGEYDLAGCIVGLAERRRLLPSPRIQPGDRILGLASNGLHTNGYSLARKVLLEEANLPLHQMVEELGQTLAAALLAEHRCYLPTLAPWVLGMKPAVRKHRRGPQPRPDVIKGLAHITGGGIPGNLPRILPEGCSARIDPHAWPEPALFRLIARLGRVPRAEMRRTFNLGLGMLLVAAPADVEELRRYFQEREEACHEVGEIVAGPRRVSFGQA